jgi:hypothetical protein
MPDPIMLTEIAFLFRAAPTPRRARQSRSRNPFKTWAELEKINTRKIGPAKLCEAAGACAGCPCCKQCRRWLRTGVFRYAGDPRCPNAVLLCS